MRSAQSFLKAHAWQYTKELLAKNRSDKFSLNRERTGIWQLFNVSRAVIKVLNIILLQKPFNDLGDTINSAVKPNELHSLKSERTHI